MSSMIKTKMEMEEEEVQPPANGGSLRHLARGTCEDCQGDGRIIVEFTRTEPPRQGEKDWDVVACKCTRGE